MRVSFNVMDFPPFVSCFILVSEGHPVLQWEGYFWHPPLCSLTLMTHLSNTSTSWNHLPRKPINSTGRQVVLHVHTKGPRRHRCWDGHQVVCRRHWCASSNTTRQPRQTRSPHLCLCVSINESYLQLFWHRGHLTLNTFPWSPMTCRINEDHPLHFSPHLTFFWSLGSIHLHGWFSLIPWPSKCLQNVAQFPSITWPHPS